MRFYSSSMEGGALRVDTCVGVLFDVSPPIPVLGRGAHSGRVTSALSNLNMWVTFEVVGIRIPAHELHNCCSSHSCREASSLMSTSSTREGRGCSRSTPPDQPTACVSRALSFSPHPFPCLDAERST